jgi:hypothetical protein
MSATIGSPLARIYSGIFDRRLRQFVSFADKQIRFTNLDGCKAYINLFGKAISCMRADSGRVITIVDIAMAFDTIPHAALKQCLQSKGVSERVASLPGLMYNDSWITIRMGTSHSIKFQLTQGVNQSNPLSPLLFNITLDPIIEAINSGTTGIDMARKNISILVFADDNLLICNNTTTAHEQLTMFSSYLTQLGMELATRKCSTFQIKTSNKTWYLADSRLQVGHELVSYANAEEVIRYLGITIRPWTGVDSTVHIASITGAANNIAGMKLKP